MDTLRSLRVELRSYNVDNENIFKSNEMHAEVNAVILQSFSNLQI